MGQGQSDGLWQTFATGDGVAVIVAGEALAAPAGNSESCLLSIAKGGGF